jgi:hypothetical protein
LRRKLERWMGELRDELGIDGFDGQTSRIVDVFALVFAAGCLTMEYGITPWSKQRLLEAVKTVFADNRLSLAQELTKGGRIAVRCTLCASWLTALGVALLAFAVIASHASGPK